MTTTTKTIRTVADARDENPAAVALGRLGGRIRSEAKAAAARRNGRRGGRPPKQTKPLP
jgi:hypothetical protein